MSILKTLKNLMMVNGKTKNKPKYLPLRLTWTGQIFGYAVDGFNTQAAAAEWAMKSKARFPFERIIVVPVYDFPPVPVPAEKEEPNKE